MAKGVPNWAKLGGAAVGASVVRWALALAVPAEWALLAVNCVGCALVGWSSGRARSCSRRLGPWFNVGLCGSLTSMSALALLVAEALRAGAVGAAVGWLAANVIGCVWAYALGTSWPGTGEARPSPNENGPPTAGQPSS